MSMKCEQYGKHPDQIEIYDVGNLIINRLYYSIVFNPDEARFVRRKINEWLDDHEDRRKTMNEEDIDIVVVEGVEGPSLYVDNHRVAGSKPWGGGHVQKKWTTTRRNILSAFLGNWTTQPSISGPMLDRIEGFIDSEIAGGVRRQEMTNLEGDRYDRIAEEILEDSDVDTSVLHGHDWANLSAAIAIYLRSNFSAHIEKLGLENESLRYDIDEAKSIIEIVENRCMAVDGAVGSTAEHITDEELRRLYKALARSTDTEDK